MPTEYRDCNPPEEELGECKHCGYPDTSVNGYCSKNCYHYDNE